MSDMMGGRPMGGAPGGSPGGGAMSSMLNPRDVAMKATTGEIGPNMTVEQFLGQMGVRPQDPVGKLAQALKGQIGGATMMGKISGGAPGGQMGSPPAPGGAGLDALLSKYKGGMNG